MSNRKNGLRRHCRSWVIVGLMMELAWGAFTLTASAQTPLTPPDTTVCNGVGACDAPKSFCDAEGFKVTLKSFTDAANSNSGEATYVYEICEPPAGTCSISGNSCLDNSQCGTNGGTCSRACAVDNFHGLSHFDVAFPLLVDTTSCLSGNNEVTGSCACETGSSSSCSVDSAITIGDGSCFANTCVKPDTCSVGSGSNKTCSVSGIACHNDSDCNPGTCSQTGNSCQTSGSCGPTPVAKCDNTNLGPGDCILMTLEIAGETNGLGVGPIVLVTKDATTCEATCGAGPSCDPCNESNGSACLTRTLGFWGTHPWITNNYATDTSQVSVCWKGLDCDDPDDGKSNPACNAGSCDSVMEGLGSNPGQELSTNQPYVSMIKQLTAAKLNLKATAALVSGATCSSWTYQGKTIQQWIDYCEGTFDGTQVVGGFCYGNKSQISNSGCIEALDAFNNSGDTGFAQTPAPFDRPSVDDHGNVSGADPTQFKLAQGNSTPPGKWVIGKKVGSNNCQ